MQINKKIPSLKEYRESFPGIPIFEYQNGILMYFQHQKKIVFISNIDEQKNLNEIKELFDNELIYQSKRSIFPNLQQLTLIITEKCNLACKYCYLKGINAVDSIDMPWDVAKRAIQYIFPKINGTPLLSFFGGEPILNLQNIIRAVELANNINPNTCFHISTNATFKKNICQILAEYNFSVSISCDGLENYHNELRKDKNGKNTWNMVINNLRILTSLNIPVIVRMTLTDINMKSLVNAVQYFLDDIGIKFFHIELEISNTYLFQTYSEKRIQDLISCFDDIIRILEKNNSFLFQSSWQNISTPRSWFCSSMNGENIIITPSGKITGCYRIHDPKNIFLLGEINDKFSYYKRKKTFYSHQCDNCFSKFICGGGCLWRNLKKNGNVLVVDEQTCRIKQELLKLALQSLYRCSLNNKESPVLGEIAFTREINRRYFHENHKNTSKKQ